MLKVLVYSVSIIFAAYVLQKVLFRNSTTLHPAKLNVTYDYIIVGAGSAGSVLAARLSEDGSKSVLLLEAGGEENELFYSHIPGATTRMCNTKFDWQYKTEPQKHCCSGLVDNQQNIPRGKVLGGTSVLNWMCYVRGHPADFDRWAELGNPGWSYKDVLPYFNKAQMVHIEKFKNSKNHGHTGPLNIALAERSDPGYAFMEGAKELGYKEISDTALPEDDGFGVMQYFAYNGVRQSTVRMYLRPAMTRNNLHVVANAHVTKVLFKTSKNQEHVATGVEYLFEGKRHQIKATKEVILSAGAINSPQILMLSGIGPAAHLKEVGIPVLVDSPAVGQNFDDHLAFYVLYSLNVTDATEYEHLFTIRKLLKAIPKYIFSGTGAFSQPPMELLGYFHSGLTTDHDGPDIQLFINKDHGINPPEVLNYKMESYLSAATEPPFNMSTMTFQPTLLHTHSRGEIRLRTNNPLDHAIIDPNYFNNDIDAKILAIGLKIVMDVMNSKAMAKYSPKLLEKPMPGCQHTKFLSDDYMECIAKTRGFALYHQIGTCRMGPKGQNSVVDNNLRVHGVKNLRVADASIYPEQVSGNTNAPTIMVAEKAADLILQKNI